MVFLPLSNTVFELHPRFAFRHIAATHLVKHLIHHQGLFAKVFYQNLPKAFTLLSTQLHWGIQLLHIPGSLIKVFLLIIRKRIVSSQEDRFRWNPVSCLQEKQRNHHGHHRQHGQPLPKMAVTPQGAAHCLHVGIAPCRILTSAFGCNVVVSMWKDLLQQQPESILVGTAVDFDTMLQLLRRHITHRASRLFQDGVVVGIRQTEVDDLHVVAIARNKDVARLQVTVQDLFAVDVGQSIHQLIDNLASELFRRLALQELVKCHTIDVLHDDAGTNTVVFLLGKGLYNVGMVELNHQLVFLFQQLEIDLLVAKLRFQAFQDEPPALSLHLHQLIEATALQRFVGSVHIGRQDELLLDRSRCDDVVHGGIRWHKNKE